MKIKRTHTTITSVISMTVVGIDSMDDDRSTVYLGKPRDFCGRCCNFSWNRIVLSSFDNSNDSISKQMIGYAAEKHSIKT